MASLNPARWGRQGSHNFTKDTNASTTNALSKNPSNSNLIAAGNREKARQWIRDQAILFITKYSEPDAHGGGNGRNTTSSVLSRLAGKMKQIYLIIHSNAIDRTFTPGELSPQYSL